MTHGSSHRPMALLGGLSPPSIHAPPLAEEAASGPRGRARARCRRLLARGCSRWPRATTSSRAWSCAPARAGRCVRAVRPARIADAGDAGWTLLVQGVDLHDDARASAAAALPLHPRRAPRRRDVLVRERRRRRRPARRFLRRVPAAGARAPALAHRPRARQARCATTCR